MYEYHSPETISPGLRLSFQTNLNSDPNGTVAVGVFQDDCYPPGTWPIGVC